MYSRTCKESYLEMSRILIFRWNVLYKSIADIRLNLFQWKGRTWRLCSPKSYQKPLKTKPWNILPKCFVDFFKELWYTSLWMDNWIYLFQWKGRTWRLCSPKSYQKPLKTKPWNILPKCFVDFFKELWYTNLWKGF